MKIDPKGQLNAATLGNSEQLQVGDWVLAIGNPFGLSNTVTAGIVSAKGRIIGAGPYDDFIQTDASINPGNSGGPLFNMKGEVVGINTAIIPNGQGIGFAIPVNVAKPLIPQLISKGEVTRGYIGVSIQAITPELAKAMNLKDAKGALVSDVVPGSPADKGGLKPGDVIITFDRKNIDGPRDLSSWVAQTPVGQDAKVGISREGSEKQLTLKVEKFGSEGSKIRKIRIPRPRKVGSRVGRPESPKERIWRIQEQPGCTGGERSTGESGGPGGRASGRHPFERESPAGPITSTGR